MASSGRHFISMFNSSQYEEMMKTGGLEICETGDRFLETRYYFRSLLDLIFSLCNNFNTSTYTLCVYVEYQEVLPLNL